MSGRDWIRDHNRRVRQRGGGVRIIACYLPLENQWIDATDANWVHGKRRVVEADGLLTINELADRVSNAYSSPLEPPLIMPNRVA